MTEDNDCSGDLFLQLMKLLISLLDFLIKGLVFNLKLFEIDQMKTIS